MLFIKRLTKQNNMQKHFITTLFLATVLSAGQAQESLDFHKSLTVVDGHNDVIYESIIKGRDIGKRLSKGQTDIPRLKEGGVDVQVFAVCSDDKKLPDGKAYKHANAQIDALEKAIKNNAHEIALAKNSEEIQQIVASGKIAAVIGVEGGNMIESSIANLEALYNRGARYLTLTWNYNVPWAS